MHRGIFDRPSRFLKSKEALAIPVTYLILFASLLTIVTATYSLAAVKISSKGNLLRASVAKQNMLFLDDAVGSVSWSFSGSEVIYMDNCGGVFRTAAGAQNLALNITDSQSFYSIAFNSSLGKAYYELDASELNEDSLFIRGDENAIVNKTSSTMTQLQSASGPVSKEVILSYRPLATSAAIGTRDGKPLNLIRIHVISLNSSGDLSLRGGFHLKVTSENVITIKEQYEFSHAISSLAVRSTLGGSETIVWLPVSSTVSGVFVDLEIVVCSVHLQKTEV